MMLRLDGCMKIKCRLFEVPALRSLRGEKEMRAVGKGIPCQSMIVG